MNNKEKMAFNEIEWPDLDNMPYIHWRDEWVRFSYPLRCLVKICMFSMLLTLLMCWVLSEKAFFLFAFSSMGLMSCFLGATIFFYWKSNAAYYEIFKYGIKVPAKVLQGIPDSSAFTIPRARIKFLVNTKFGQKKASCELLNVNFSREHLADHYFPPRTGDLMIVYYLDKYPDLCYPVSSQLFK